MTRFLINILCIILLATFAQAKPPVFIDIPSSGSLRTSTVHTFHKDSQQILWIGTDKEIIAFDGNNSLHTTILDDNNIPVTTYDFVETRNSDILAATNNGLYKVDFTSDSQKETHIFPNKITSANCLAVTANDSILVGTDKGMFVISADLKSCSQPYIHELKIKAIVPDGKRTFIATDQGVLSIDLATKKPTPIYGPLNATDLLRDSDRLYAVSATGELVIIDLNKGHAHPINTGGAYISEIDNDSHGNLFIATDGDGVLMYSPATSAISPLRINRAKSNDEHNKQVYALMVDNFDRMHLGYYLMGAEHSLLNNDTFSMMPIPGADPGVSVRAVHTDGNNLMVGTREGAFFIDKATGKSTHLTKEALGSGLVLTIEKINGKYYIGTYGGGLSIFDPATMSTSAYHDNRIHGSVFSICKDKNGFTWLGTSSGVYKLDGKKIVSQITTTEAKDSLANIYAVFFDSAGRGWASSAKGVYTIDADNERLVPSDLVEDKDVRQFYETRNHDLWVVTNSGHISVYKSDLQKSDLNKLVSSITEARGVVEDSKGRIWITTANGLFKCSPFNESLSSFGFIDGIPSPMFNSGAPKISDEGIIYLCHTGGLLQADLKSAPDGILSHRKAHPSILTEANGSRLLKDIYNNEAYHIDLLSPQKQISLSLSDGSFAGNEMVRYEYSTDHGSTWQHVTPDMKISLSPSGESLMDIIVRQIGNPLTTTNISINNPKSYGIWIWIGITAAIILLVCSGWAYTIYLYRKRHNAEPQPMAIPQKPAALAEDASETAKDESSTATDIAPAEAADSEEPEQIEPENKKYAANYLSEKECAKIAKQVKTLLQETKLFTDPDLKIGTIAERIGISSHKLSYVFSQHLHTSYYDYIYEFRVEEFKRLALADKKQTYTLVALSEKAGFNSRATFFRAFKKLEGITPGDFLRQLREKE